MIRYEASERASERKLWARLPKSVIGVDKWVRYGASSKGTRRLLFDSYGRSWTEMERGGVEGGKSELTEREREVYGIRVARWPVHYHNRIPLREGPPTYLDNSPTLYTYSLWLSFNLNLAKNIYDNYHFPRLLLFDNSSRKLEYLSLSRQMMER